MRSKCLLVACLVTLVAWSLPDTAAAQDGPGSRIVTVATFQVPYGEREHFMPFFRDRFLVTSQLNPNVINARVLFHAWGSTGDQIVLIREYADMEGLAAGCGTPCEEWNEANPAPQEGEEGYEEFMEGVRAFQKYYSSHSDEIYGTPLGWGKVEGEVMGRIGPAVEEESGE